MTNLPFYRLLVTSSLFLLLTLSLFASNSVNVARALAGPPTNVILNPSFENGTHTVSHYIYDNGSQTRSYTAPADWDFDPCEGVSNGTATLDSTTSVDGAYSAKVYTGPITNVWCVPASGTRTVGFTQFRTMISPAINFTDLTDSPTSFSFWFKLEPYSSSGIEAFDIRVFGAESIGELDYVINPTTDLTYPNNTGRVASLLFHGYEYGQWYHFSRNLKQDWLSLGLPLNHLFSLIMFEGIAFVDLGGTLKSTSFWLDDVRVYADNPPPPTVTISGVTPNPATTGETVTAAFSVTSSAVVHILTIDWGDGVNSKVSPTATSATHTYLNTGNAPSQGFTINIMATNGGGQGYASAQEVVNDRPPAITVTNISPNPADTGQLITLNFTASDPDGNVSFVAVNWGDGSTPDLILAMPGASMCPPVNCAIPQNAVILLQERDPDTILLAAIIAFRPFASSPEYLVVHRVISIIAAGSQTDCTEVGFFTKGDANLVQDPWDSGCGIPGSQVVGIYISTLAPPGRGLLDAYSTHQYVSTGNSSFQAFTIHLNATDNSGSSTQQTMSQTINNQKPKITIATVSPSNPFIGTVVSINFTAEDPDGSISSLSIDWGDGSGLTDLANNATFTQHTFASPGTFTVRIAAIDSSRESTVRTVSLRINNQEPTVTLTVVSPSDLLVGTRVTINFTAQDPDGSIASITVDWGDGSAPTDVLGSSTSAIHTYLLAGSFTIEVKAVDNYGSSSNPATQTVLVSAPPSPVQNPSIMGVAPELFYAVVGGIVAIIGGSTLVWFLRRRD